MKVYCTIVNAHSDKANVLYEFIHRYTMDLTDKEPRQRELIQTIKQYGYECACFKDVPDYAAEMRDYFTVIRDDSIDEETAVLKGYLEFLLIKEEERN